MIVSKYSEKNNIYRFNFHFDDIRITISNLYKKASRNSSGLLIFISEGDIEQVSNLDEFFASDHVDSVGAHSESELQRLFLHWIFRHSSIKNCHFVE